MYGSCIHPVQFKIAESPYEGLHLKTPRTGTVNVNVICLLTEQQGVHKNSLRNVRAFQDRIGIWKCWFLRRGENWSTPGKKPFGAEQQQQQTQPTYDAGSRNRTQDTSVGGDPSHHCAISAPTLQCYLQQQLKRAVS